MQPTRRSQDEPAPSDGVPADPAAYRPIKPHPRVLVVDDDPAIGRMLRILLGSLRYRVDWERTGAEGLARAARSRPDAVILDLNLPGGDGYPTLAGIREWSDIPVLILSDLASVSDTVRALDAGANDYMAKPFAAEELAARLRVLLRCAPPDDGPVLLSGPLRVDMVTHESTVHGRPLRLTATEGAVLHILARHAGKFVPSGHIIRAVWGPCAERKRHDLNVHIAHLRRKLRELGADGLICGSGNPGYSLSLAALQHALVPDAAT
jgi:two-component system KDP operon response regulator KdpE